LSSNPSPSSGNTTASQRASPVDDDPVLVDPVPVEPVPVLDDVVNVGSLVTGFVLTVGSVTVVGIVVVVVVVSEIVVFPVDAVTPEVVGSSTPALAVHAGLGIAQADDNNIHPAVRASQKPHLIHGMVSPRRRHGYRSSRSSANVGASSGQPAGAREACLRSH